MARNRRRERDGDALAGPGGIGPGSANGHDEADEASPLRHATPDVELAEAQLALGRPELSGAPADEESLAAEAVAAAPRGVARTTPAATEVRADPITRLRGFLQGSWRELQRVQWPDRRQVMQATGVVIGFVIVAGAFLGVADWAAGKVVTLILK